MEFQLIKIDGDSPYGRGIQYGIAAADKIRAGVENYRRFFEETSGQTWEETLSYAASFVPLIEERMPEVLSEAKGIAEGAGVSLDELMVLNCRYEITKFPAKKQECTTAALAPPATKDDKVYLIKNWDYRPGVIENIVILHIVERETGTRIIGLAEAGQMIREGFNSHGVGLVNNMIQSIYDTKGIGIPVTFLRRKVLSVTSFEEAKTLLETSPRSVSNNMLLADGEGHALDFEASPKDIGYLKPIDGVLTHANHFVVNPEYDAMKKEPKNRDNRLHYLFQKHLRQIDISYIKECMKDHEYYPAAICNHEFDPAEDPMKGFMTVASMIIDFGENQAHICCGNPCEGNYKVYDL